MPLLVRDLHCWFFYKAMLEDKIRATDYEATVEAIEEQVASESYLDYLRDIDRRNKQVTRRIDRQVLFLHSRHADVHARVLTKHEDHAPVLSNHG